MVASTFHRPGDGLPIAAVCAMRSTAMLLRGRALYPSISRSGSVLEFLSAKQFGRLLRLLTPNSYRFRGINHWLAGHVYFTMTAKRRQAENR